MSYTENYQKWLDFAELPAYLRDELVSMDEKTKEDAFYTNLEFGTAGMRGLKNVVLLSLMTAVISLLSLLLNLRKF